MDNSKEHKQWGESWPKSKNKASVILTSSIRQTLEDKALTEKMQDSL